jgi:hypothetical protein
LQHDRRDRLLAEPGHEQLVALDALAQVSLFGRRPFARPLLDAALVQPGRRFEQDRARDGRVGE